MAVNHTSSVDIVDPNDPNFDPQTKVGFTYDARETLPADAISVEVLAQHAKGKTAEAFDAYFEQEKATTQILHQADEEYQGRERTFDYTSPADKRQHKSFQRQLDIATKRLEETAPSYHKMWMNLAAEANNEGSERANISPQTIHKIASNHFDPFAPIVQNPNQDEQKELAFNILIDDSEARLQRQYLYGPNGEAFAQVLYDKKTERCNIEFYAADVDERETRSLELYDRAIQLVQHCDAHNYIPAPASSHGAAEDEEHNAEVSSRTEHNNKRQLQIKEAIEKDLQRRRDQLSATIGSSQVKHNTTTLAKLVSLFRSGDINNGDPTAFRKLGNMRTFNKTRTKQVFQNIHATQNVLATLLGGLLVGFKLAAKRVGLHPFANINIPAFMRIVQTHPALKDKQDILIDAFCAMFGKERVDSHIVDALPGKKRRMTPEQWRVMKLAMSLYLKTLNRQDFQAAEEHVNKEGSPEDILEQLNLLSFDRLVASHDAEDKQFDKAYTHRADKFQSLTAVNHQNQTRQRYEEAWNRRTKRLAFFIHSTEEQLNSITKKHGTDPANHTPKTKAQIKFLTAQLKAAKAHKAYLHSNLSIVQQQTRAATRSVTTDITEFDNPEIFEQLGLDQPTFNEGIPTPSFSHQLRQKGREFAIDHTVKQLAQTVHQYFAPGDKELNSDQLAKLLNAEIQIPVHSESADEEDIVTAIPAGQADTKKKEEGIPTVKAVNDEPKRTVTFREYLTERALLNVDNPDDPATLFPVFNLDMMKEPYFEAMANATNHQASKADYQALASTCLPDTTQAARKGYKYTDKPELASTPERLTELIVDHNLSAEQYQDQTSARLNKAVQEQSPEIDLSDKFAKDLIQHETATSFLFTALTGRFQLQAPITEALAAFEQATQNADNTFTSDTATSFNKQLTEGLKTLQAFNAHLQNPRISIDSLDITDTVEHIHQDLERYKIRMQNVLSGDPEANKLVAQINQLQASLKAISDIYAAQPAAIRQLTTDNIGDISSQEIDDPIFTGEKITLADQASSMLKNNSEFESTLTLAMRLQDLAAPVIAAMPNPTAAKDSRTEDAADAATLDPYDRVMHSLLSLNDNTTLPNFSRFAKDTATRESIINNTFVTFTHADGSESTMRVPEAIETLLTSDTLNSESLGQIISAIETNAGNSFGYLQDTGLEHLHRDAQLKAKQHQQLMTQVTTANQSIELIADKLAATLYTATRFDDDETVNTRSADYQAIRKELFDTMFHKGSLDQAAFEQLLSKIIRQQIQAYKANTEGGGVFQNYSEVRAHDAILNDIKNQTYAAYKDSSSSNLTALRAELAVAADKLHSASETLDTATEQHQAKFKDLRAQLNTHQQRLSDHKQEAKRERMQLVENLADAEEELADATHQSNITSLVEPGNEDLFIDESTNPTNPEHIKRLKQAVTNCKQAITDFESKQETELNNLHKQIIETQDQIAKLREEFRNAFVQSLIGSSDKHVQISTQFRNPYTQALQTYLDQLPPAKRAEALLNLKVLTPKHQQQIGAPDCTLRSALNYISASSFTHHYTQQIVHALASEAAKHIDHSQADQNRAAFEEQMGDTVQEGHRACHAATTLQLNLRDEVKCGTENGVMQKFCGKLSRKLRLVRQHEHDTISISYSGFQQAIERNLDDESLQDLLYRASNSKELPYGLETFSPAQALAYVTEWAKEHAPLLVKHLPSGHASAAAASGAFTKDEHDIHELAKRFSSILNPITASATPTASATAQPDTTADGISKETAEAVVASMTPGATPKKPQQQTHTAQQDTPAATLDEDKIQQGVIDKLTGRPLPAAQVDHSTSVEQEDASATTPSTATGAKKAKKDKQQQLVQLAALAQSFVKFKQLNELHRAIVLRQLDLKVTAIETELEANKTRLLDEEAQEQLKKTFDELNPSEQQQVEDSLKEQLEQEATKAEEEKQQALETLLQRMQNAQIHVDGNKAEKFLNQPKNTKQVRTAILKAGRLRGLSLSSDDIIPATKAILLSHHPEFSNLPDSELSQFIQEQAQHMDSYMRAANFDHIVMVTLNNLSNKDLEIALSNMGITASRYLKTTTRGIPPQTIIAGIDPKFRTEYDEFFNAIVATLRAGENVSVGQLSRYFNVDPQDQTHWLYTLAANLNDQSEDRNNLAIYHERSHCKTHGIPPMQLAGTKFGTTQKQFMADDHHTDAANPVRRQDGGGGLRSKSRDLGSLNPKQEAALKRRREQLLRQQMNAADKENRQSEGPKATSPRSNL